jgi:hypothetical protein
VKRQGEREKMKENVMELKEREKERDIKIE